MDQQTIDGEYDAEPMRQHRWLPSCRMSIHGRSEQPELHYNAKPTKPAKP